MSSFICPEGYVWARKTRSANKWINAYTHWGDCWDTITYKQQLIPCQASITQMIQDQGPFQYECGFFSCIGISIITKRQLWYGVIFILRIPMLVRRLMYIESGTLLKTLFTVAHYDQWITSMTVQKPEDRCTHVMRSAYLFVLNHPPKVVHPYPTIHLHNWRCN